MNGPPLLRCLTLAAAFLGSADAIAVDELPDEVGIDGIEFVRVPAGDFWYAVATDYPNDRKIGAAAYREVRVWLGEFYIAKYEARAADFVRYMNSGRARQDWIGDPHYWLAEVDGCTVTYVPGTGFRERFPGANLPATAVSWDMANEFSAALGFRLPNEAEWQKAARGTDRRLWPWGSEHPDETFANHSLGVHCAPAPVDSYSKGISPYGVYNMSGNVAEWVSNWYNVAFDRSLRDGTRNPAPPAAPAVFEAGLAWPAKVVKGGRWGSVSGSITIAMRELSRAGDSNSSSGLRFAVDSSVVRQRLSAGTATIVRERRGEHGGN